MNEDRLKEILETYDAPPPDDNARKAALNLALAAFDAAQKEKKESFQGSSFLSRLMGRSNQDERRIPMNRKYIYGGMATAMAVVLVCGVSVQQFQNQTGWREGASPLAARSSQRIEFSTAPSGSKEGLVAKNEKKDRAEMAAPKTESADKGYAAAVEEANIAAVEQALREGGSGLPTPVKQPLGRVPSADAPNDALSNRANKPDGRRKQMAGEADAIYRAEAPSLSSESKAMIQERENVAGGIIAPYAMPVSPPVFVGDEIVAREYYQDVGRDKFEDFEENQIKTVNAEPVSTFSIDVDTSSYSFVRRQINSGILPQKDAVRIEEMINYFDYDYPLPAAKEQPFQSSVTVVPSPWKDGNKLVHIGIKGYDMDRAQQPRSNLVFLVDVSGSMNEPTKLPLVVQSMKLLLDTLKPDDTVGIVVYAGAAGTVLEPTRISEKTRIIAALDNLNAGGSTAGAEGIRQAYQLAEANFDKNAVNRVILASDGDFNVGITNPEELKDFVERKRETGIFLSVLGFGQGNLNDAMMQDLAQNGNGVAAYIDTINEARKVLVQEATSALFPIAKDVKIQVEFNPATVAEYRLVGYETRHLNREDFNNDKVDAGDIGAGHTVTAIYEITPVGGPRAVDDSRYGAKPAETKADTDFSGEYAFLKIRYKLPAEDTSKLITTAITAAAHGRLWDCPPCPANAVCEPCAQTAVEDVKFSVAVASFGQLLKGSKYTGKMTYDDVIEMAQRAKGKDEFGYRAEFVNLVRLARSAATLQDTQQ